MSRMLFLIVWHTKGNVEGQKWVLFGLKQGIFVPEMGNFGCRYP